MALTIISITVSPFLILFFLLQYYVCALCDTHGRPSVSVILIERQRWQLGKIIFPFKNKTQVDLDGVEVKNGVTSRLFWWLDRSKCNLINGLWVFDDISYIHWDIIVYRSPIVNAIMRIFSKKSASLLFAHLKKVACLLFLFVLLASFCRICVAFFYCM